MRFGAQVNVYQTRWDDIETVVGVLEEGRWNSVWFADHFLPPNRPPETEVEAAYEGFTAIAAVAGMTEKLRLGHLVLGNTYRNPALVAKMAATLDQISRGRFTLGIGAAWFKREHEAYGWAFPPMKERQDRFEEACRLIRLLFTSDGPVDFDGEYYNLERAPLSPGCYQEPHLPILVGGTGERRTLRTLARYGDVFNLDGWAGGGMSLEYYRHKISVLERHCDDAGRDPAEIRKTLLMPLRLTDDPAQAERYIAAFGPGTVAGPRDYIIERLGEFRDEGVDEVMFGGIPNEHPELYRKVDEEIIAAFD